MTDLIPTYLIEDFYYNPETLHIDIIYYLEEWEESKILDISETIYLEWLLKNYRGLVLEYNGSLNDLLLDDKPAHLKLEFLNYCINSLKLK